MSNVLYLTGRRPKLKMIPDPSGIESSTENGVESLSYTDPRFNRLAESVAGITRWIKSEDGK